MYTRISFRYVCWIAAMLLFSSCSREKENTLSAKEKEQGWVLLFDGSTTNGWRNYKSAEADSWAVANGELYCKENGVNKRADLVTVNQYENYELAIDWKIVPKKNSGIIYMVTEENNASFESGPEYQLIDDLGYPDKLQDKQLSGANYDMHAPTVKVANPAGQYNRTKIVINNGHVEHWLNGTKVADYQLWIPEWEQLKAGSKWKDVKTYGMSKKGHIALQDHGGGVYFKNIKLRQLNN
jgi:hypothetical protein